MADFPTALTNAIDGSTDVLAKHLNNLETKVGINNSTITNSIDYLMKALPEGFMINGKIVPSVASNNLTVALKGMDGNGPSATNPVYVRIGSVVRSITSALSITTNAGSSWLNAGSAELATKEIDYFIHLGWNTANTRVVMTHSRLPYPTVVGDFGVTNTAENGVLVDSGWSGVVAGDPVVNIGRFAATLSAGAGYTWTVPTFTATNLIQRPVYETRWLSIRPTFTPSGSLTYSSAQDSTYMLRGRTCLYTLYGLGTLGGTASNGMLITLPISINSVAYGYATNGIYCNNATVVPTGIWNEASTTSLNIRRYDNANYTLAVSQFFLGEFVYPI